MKAKKSPKANLENKRIIYAQIGMIITLALVLLAFEWKTYDTSDHFDKGGKVDLTPEELALVTVQQKPPPPPPMPVPITTLLNQVDNDMDIDTDIDIDVEANDNTEFTLYVPDYPDEGEGEVENNLPFVSVEEMPSFPGGDLARIQYLHDNIDYPQVAVETNIQGTVYVSFIVEEDGSVSNIEILRGIGGGCDEEASRVIENMPNWNPGKQRGHPVRVKLNMHIVFTLL